MIKTIPTMYIEDNENKYYMHYKLYEMFMVDREEFYQGTIEELLEFKDTHEKDAIVPTMTIMTGKDMVKYLVDRKAKQTWESRVVARLENGQVIRYD